MTEHLCSTCGAPGEIDYLDRRAINACDEHREQAQAEVDEHYRQLTQKALTKLQTSAGFHYTRWTGLDAFNRDYADQLNPHIRNEINEWLDNLSLEGGNLYLHGGVGVGKTTLAYATAHTFIERGDGVWPVEWVTVRPLLAAIRASFNGGPPVDIDLGPKTRLVILDDLGAERVTDWTRDWLATVIEQRYDHERSSIVTTNYPPAQLAARLGASDRITGQRLVSRLIDGSIVLEIPGQDRRKRAA